MAITMAVKANAIDDGSGKLYDEIADLDGMIGAIIEELAPSLVSSHSIGRESAAQLLLTAGDNVDRIGFESRFAALCG